MQNQKVLSTERIETSIFRWLAKKDFNWGKKYQKEFESVENIKVLLEANVTKLHLGQDSRVVQKAEVKTIEGNTFSVSAKQFIVAAGGLENPRLLLLSNIGNQHDQVGRYYMDHPKELVGEIELFDKAVDLPLYWGIVNASKELRAGLKLRDSVQEEKKVLNSYVLLEPISPWFNNPGMQAVISLAQLVKGTKIPNDIIRQYVLDIFQNKKLVFGFINNEVNKRVLHKREKAKKIKLWNFMEQEPRAENRVTLSDTKDLLGLPRTTLSWSLGQLDKETMIVLHKTLATELEKLKIGILKSPLLEENIQEWPINRDASHHMGTTRMGFRQEEELITST